MSDQRLILRKLQITEKGTDLKETQNKYFKNGTSRVKFPNSKHNQMPSMAIDLAPYIKGGDPYDFERSLFLAGIVRGVADRLYQQGLMAHRLKWGGSWDNLANATFAFDRKGFYDGIHHELIGVST